MRTIDPLVLWMASIPVLLGVLVTARPRPRRMSESFLVRPPTQTPDPGHVRLQQRRKLILGGFVVMIASLVVGPVLTLAGLALAVVWPRIRLVQGQRRRTSMVAARFPDFLDLLVLTIRSGCTPVQAFAVLGASVEEPIGTAVDCVRQRIGNGDRFADAVADLRTCLGPIAQPLVDALAAADRHGASLAPMLDRLADEARAQRRRNAEVAARQLPVKLSLPLVGFTLPSFVLLTIVPLMAGTLSSIKGLRP